MKGGWKLTVLSDSTTLLELEVAILKGREVAKGELLEECLGLPLGLKGEGVVVLELDAGEGGGGEDTTDTGVA
jgi:hypothetical protein